MLPQLAVTLLVMYSPHIAKERSYSCLLQLSNSMPLRAVNLHSLLNVLVWNIFLCVQMSSRHIVPLCIAYRRGVFILTCMDWILCVFLTLRSSVFWDVTHRILLVSYRRFGRTYWSHLQGSSRTMVVRTAILLWVKSQKIADLTS